MIEVSKSKHLKAQNLCDKGFFFHYFLATSTTKLVKIFKGLLFYAETHRVRILVFEIYQSCPVPLKSIYTKTSKSRCIVYFNSLTHPPPLLWLVGYINLLSNDVVVVVCFDVGFINWVGWHLARFPIHLLHHRMFSLISISVKRNLKNQDIYLSNVKLSNLLFLWGSSLQPCHTACLQLQIQSEF